MHDIPGCGKITRDNSIPTPDIRTIYQPMLFKLSPATVRTPMAAATISKRLSRRVPHLFTLLY
jgi:hypothetical protein